MDIFYSKQTNGFYIRGIHPAFPEDAKQITENEHRDLIDGQAAGRIIRPGADGRPVLAGPYDQLVNGEWVTDTATKLKDAKGGAVLSIRQYASTVRKQIAGDADHYETAGWADKARRAERVAAGSALPGDTDILKAEADRRAKGETAVSLAELQLQKAGKFALAVSVIDGMVSSAKTAIESAGSVEEIPPLLASLKQNSEAELTALLNQ